MDPERSEVVRFLARIYEILTSHYGPTGWWPGDSDLEVIAGAVLTQNTAWTNVEKAISNLKADGSLTFQRLLDMPNDALADRIRPSGYFNVKTKRLNALLQHIQDNYEGNLAAMKRRPLKELRDELLGINGIGPETADSILLYALEKTTFVVDAYTRRILARHGIVRENVDYDTLKGLFQGSVPADLHDYKEYHALLVYLGKDYCRKNPKCDDCPISDDFPPVTLPGKFDR